MKIFFQKLTECWGCFDAVSASFNLFLPREHYISLVRSQVTYCSIIWRPALIKHITLVERIQRRATKFILNDYTSSYFDRLKKFNLLPLMYIFEFNKIIFTIKSLKYPSPSFNITNYITFNDGITRFSSRNKMIHTRSSNNVNGHFFFNRIPRLWNVLPTIDLSLSIVTNKTRI